MGVEDRGFQYPTIFRRNVLLFLPRWSSSFLVSRLSAVSCVRAEQFERPKKQAYLRTIRLQSPITTNVAVCYM